MEARARFLPLAGLTALFLALGGGSGYFAWLNWGNAILSGIALTFAAGMALLGLLFARRALLRPIMVRVDAAGIYMKRLDTTIPWEAIARVERVMALGNRVLSIVPTDGHHAVLAERPVMMTMAASERIGLPALVIDLSSTDGRAADVFAAVRDTGRVEVIDRT